MRTAWENELPARIDATFREEQRWWRRFAESEFELGRGIRLEEDLAEFLNPLSNKIEREKNRYIRTFNKNLRWVIHLNIKLKIYI